MQPQLLRRPDPLSAGTQLSLTRAGQNFCWAYDSFGNRLVQTTSNVAFPSGQSSSCSPSGTGTVYQNAWSYFNSQNQITQSNANGIAAVPYYDAAGNMTNDESGHGYLYDGEGRLCAEGNGLGGTGYVYDAAGNRVAKGTISAWSCDITTNGSVQTVQYIIGPNGEQLTELSVNSGTPTWAHTNIYAAGSLLATYDNDGLGPHFRLTDWLGTTRVQVNAAGTVEETCQSLPFGETPTGCTRATEHLFTGKERDTESGNDYMFARYYNSATGRFLSPDWDAKSDDPVPYAKLDSPQSLNLYSYVENNPIARFDPDGHSYLTYDDATHTITLYSAKGTEVGHWDAHNNVALKNTDGSYTNGPVQDGTYNVRASDASGKGWGHAGEESYGANGIAHFDGMVGATGKTMEGAGVHSGREDNTAHVTLGCVRTTDAATTQMKKTAKDDPLTSLEIKDNQGNVDAWKKKKAASEKAAPGANKKQKEPKEEQ